MKKVRLLLSLLALTWTGVCAAQIVSGGGGGAAPRVSGNDERLKLGARFAEHYRSGTVGKGLQQFGHLPTMFSAMFGEEWDASPAAEREEITQLYIESMNIACAPPPGKVPAPLQPGDVTLIDAQEKTAKVGILFRVNNKPTQFMLRLALKDDGWRIVDGYNVGEPSYVENMRRGYAPFKEKTTALEFMREIYRAMLALAEEQAAQAATQPSR